jgi:hypothetical protein
MKRLITCAVLFISAIASVGSAVADDPGPLTPCYDLMSNGWEILRMRNGGMKLDALITRTKTAANRNNVPTDEVNDTVEWITEVWNAPGDGWDWITAEFQKCKSTILYGSGQN